MVVLNYENSDSHRVVENCYRTSKTLVNPRKRKLYEAINVLFVTDQGKPVFCIDVGDMDSEMVAACEEDEKDADNLEGQMNITDFPEVIP